MSPTSVQRTLPSEEAELLVELAHRFANEKLAPAAAEAEAVGRFPRALLRELGELGLLGMPYPERVGGGGQTYEVYLQALEELARGWATVGVSVSVHVMSCYPLAMYGTGEQQERWLAELVGGGLLGGYCLSEAHAGSDPAAMRCRAESSARGYRLVGSKAWVTHGGDADYYAVFARTSDDGPRGISCFLVAGDAPGLSAQPPEIKMGLTGSRTSTIDFNDVDICEQRRIGEQGQGLGIAFSALDRGRLGIAAVAVGVAQAALDHAIRYAGDRETFGRPIIEHQGIGFLLADMAAAVQSARATTLEAARRHDRGLPLTLQASVAKLIATDAAMRVTTDAVQVLGGAGYTRDFPVERLMREAKVMQIFEGTNQIQRLVIAKQLARQANHVR